MATYLSHILTCFLESEKKKIYVELKRITAEFTQKKKQSKRGAVKRGLFLCCVQSKMQEGLAARFLKCSLHALQKFHHHFQAADLTQVKNFSEEMMSTRGVGSFILSIALAVVIENVV